MLKPLPKHIDPIRFPKLVEPIEKELEKIGQIEIKKIIVDVTKVIVK